MRFWRERGCACAFELGLERVDVADELRAPFAFELERLFARGGEISGALGLLGGDLVLDALEFLGLACAFELDLERGALHCERVAAEHGGCELGVERSEFALVDGW